MKIYKLNTFMQLFTVVLMSILIFQIFFYSKSVLNGTNFNFVGCIVSSLIWGGGIGLVSCFFPIPKYIIDEDILIDVGMLSRKSRMFYEIQSIEEKKLYIKLIFKDGTERIFHLLIFDKSDFLTEVRNKIK